MGIESPLEPHYSLALGTAGVSPLEMSRAFGAFANSGVLWSSLMLKRVETYDNEILDAFQTSSKKVVNAQSIYILVDMLRGVIEGGTGQSVKSLGFSRPCAGKTGTSSDFKDSWFVGFTPNLVTAVWVGFDDARSMYDKYGVGITGARGALPIWTAFMKAALENQPVRYFTRPAGIEFKIVDPKTGTGPLPGSEKLEVAIKAGM